MKFDTPSGFQKFIMESVDIFEDHDKLSPFASLISRNILEKLEKQILLAKVAVTKSDNTVKTCDGIKSTNSLEGKFSAEKDNISLEATLEYTKLTNEFSKLDNQRRESRGSIYETFSEDVDFILSLISKSKQSLKAGNACTVLKEDVVKASLHLNAEHQLKEDVLQTEEKNRKMKQVIQKRGMEMSLEEQQKVGTISCLKDTHHTLKTEGNETLKFVDAFFEAKSCNVNSTHKTRVEAESTSIAKLNQQVDRDVHCLAVMESWTEDFCQQLEAKIDEWKRKLRGDELVMDMRIDAKRRAIKSQEELIKSINETVFACLLVY